MKTTYYVSYGDVGESGLPVGMSVQQRQVDTWKRVLQIKKELIGKGKAFWMRINIVVEVTK